MWKMASPSWCESTPGTRAAAVQAGTNDNKIEVHLDDAVAVVKAGRKFKDYRFQVNTGAGNPTLKTFAEINPHQAWSHPDMPVVEENPQGVML
jgi:hypothetical protein